MYLKKKKKREKKKYRESKCFSLANIIFFTLDIN